jgi:tetratricopeptide (TPR) repeat protein
MRSIICVLLQATLLCAPARAQTRKPTDRELAEARQHFEKAEAAKARGEFRTAAVEYLAAYEKFQEPEFFFNVGEVYRLGGDKRQSLEYYRKYLELDPRGRGAVAARAAVDELSRELAAEEDAARRAAEAAAARRAQSTPAPPAPPPAPVRDEPRPGRGLRIAGLVTAGAGLAAVGAGVFFGLRASGIEDEAADWDTFDAGRFDEGEAAERNMWIAYGVGAALVATGGLLYVLGARPGARDAPQVRLAPVVTPSAVGLAAAGRF